MFLRKKIIVMLKLQNYKILLFRVTIHGDGNVVPIRKYYYLTDAPSMHYSNVVL